MKKGFIAVLCIVISVLVWAGQSTQATSSVTLPKVYPYYLLDNGDDMCGLGLNFEYNTFCNLLGKLNNGTWEVIDDTLYVYNGIYIRELYDHQHINNPDSFNPYCFHPPIILGAIKMARFVITAGGDSLIGVINNVPFKGTPSSIMDAIDPPYYHLMSILATPSTPPVIHYDNTEGVRWVKIPSPDLCGVFDVRRIDRADDFTLVVAEKDSMNYYIVADSGVKWVEDARVGAKVPLRLSRFEADTHPRSVTSYPDSIYVMYYDVYGYWDAEWCEECRNMDNDRGSYYKRMLDSIVEARPVRQDTIRR